MEHNAFVAISLVSNPSFSKFLIKICCAAFNGGAIIVNDTKAEGRRNGRVTANSSLLRYLALSLYKSHKPQA